ncbi:predicted protein [Postia placenta Mad-698-R]|uniref:Uncharacterized protein n=2 Tax=Rhodonia placenta TaxID=104341 RepID=A0A1X6MVH0_9APHY|nr:hypothetical protein POSPLADRAFT_1058378 [Postia placenta MAD-698-R-SB12]EED84707.1 predicted protein [Postia placenta Mad-698-R]KAF9821190.1 hypothetical protein IEO21_00798 [Postia placenta]OSX60203.1 hypothetical protein POSPLADRAFT_1058378 [Postia placenta MAD-698-R-SB12]
MGMIIDTDDEAEWIVPQVQSVADFELCRAVKERGRPTGVYELLDESMVVKNTLANWDAVFVRFKNTNGELLPIKVLLPPVLDEEEDEAELAAARKGKRKAPPETQ